MYLTEEKALPVATAEIILSDGKAVRVLGMVRMDEEEYLILVRWGFGTHYGFEYVTAWWREGSQDWSQGHYHQTLGKAKKDFAERLLSRVTTDR